MKKNYYSVNHVPALVKHSCDTNILMRDLFAVAVLPVIRNKKAKLRQNLLNDIACDGLAKM